MEGEPQRLPETVERPETPGEIYIAYALFAFVLASPVIGLVALEHDARGDTVAALIVWLLGGLLAAVVGIVFTLSGVRFQPRSSLTKAAIVSCWLVIPGMFLVLLMSLEIMSLLS